MNNQKYFAVIAKSVFHEEVLTEELNLPLEAEFELPSSLIFQRYEFDCPACGKPHEGLGIEKYAGEPVPDELYPCAETGALILVNMYPSHDEEVAEEQAL